MRMAFGKTGRRVPLFKSSRDVFEVGEMLFIAFYQSIQYFDMKDINKIMIKKRFLLIMKKTF
jgi:hypothetical protein